MGMSLSDELRKSAQQSAGLSDMLRGTVANSTQASAVPTQQPNFPKELPKPSHPYQSEVDFATKMYPNVQGALVKTIFGMESDTGKNAANKDKDAGQYGYLSGITKTGRFGDMLKMKPKKPFEVFRVLGDEAKGITSPKAAAAVTASIVQQLIDQTGIVPNSPENAWKLYNEHYKTLEGAKPTPQMKQKFLSLFKEHSG